MVTRAAVAIALLAMATRAYADDAKLAQARAAIEAVRYDEARPLLDEALRTGGNSPAAVTLIYQLSATTAIVLGDKQAAARFYRHWLVLDPRAALPRDAGDKFREPFVAALDELAVFHAFVLRPGLDAPGILRGFLPRALRRAEQGIRVDTLARIIGKTDLLELTANLLQ